MVEDLCAIPADKIDPFIVEYLKSKDINELFLKCVLSFSFEVLAVFGIQTIHSFFWGRIVKRLEATYSPQLVEGILKRVCSSRHGLSQRELLAMMQLEKVLQPFRSPFCVLTTELLACLCA